MRMCSGRLEIKTPGSEIASVSEPAPKEQGHKMQGRLEIENQGLREDFFLLRVRVYRLGYVLLYAGRVFFGFSGFEYKRGSISMDC